MHTIKEAVQQKYGEAALNARSGAAKAGCGCGTSCGPDPITANLYDDTQAAGVPAEALLASLGCGNPTALAELKAGEILLPLPPLLLFTLHQENGYSSPRPQEEWASPLSK